MALIFCPGVSTAGESPGGDAVRVERGVDGADMVDYMIIQKEHKFI
jgi:hypothetical protein